MEKEQQLEWAAAQSIVISEDLIAAAKQQLLFLAEIDRNRGLYEGPALQRAIYRYNACWLPLLAKHNDSRISDVPLVVPLDCEWIWHCHRLNPLRYKSDCEKLYGKILDNHDVISSTQGISDGTTEEIWSRLYPEEPYNLNLTKASSDCTSEKSSKTENFTQYDLVSAVKRQSPFFYQVSRSCMNNDHFLEGALERYKGFLHLIRRNKERSIKSFCVPTYDIDLIWHTHQLHPVSYRKDLMEVLGKVLEHDDMDSDRTKGKKLDVGFTGTTKQWEDKFGQRYWRAGAMYRGSAPSPVTNTPCVSQISRKKVIASSECSKLIKLPEVKVIEILLEVIGVKNLPEGQKGTPFVWFSKKQPDSMFSTKRKLSILSVSGENQVASFQCESSGELLIELVSDKSSNVPLRMQFKSIGSVSLSLKEFVDPPSQLYVEKWFELVPSSANLVSKPVNLRIAVSFSVPTVGPSLLRIIHSRPFSKGSCFFPLLQRVHHSRSWTRVLDGAGSEIISLQIRDSIPAKLEPKHPIKEVVGITESGEIHTLAELIGSKWSLVDSQWSLEKSTNTDHVYDVVGDKVVKLYLGRKLDYELKHCVCQKNESDFITAVKFSAENPYGNAVSLINLKTGYLTVKEEWFVVPGIVLGFILSYILKEEGYASFAVSGENIKNKGNLIPITSIRDGALKTSTGGPKFDMQMPDAIMVGKKRSKSGGCGDGYGSGCGNAVESGGCGGGGCGSMMKSSGCGGCGAGGCGSGCGSMFKSSGCGGCGAGGCGSGCGSMFKSSGCGGCGGGSCGGGCGGGCGGKAKASGCGDKVGGEYNVVVQPVQ